MSLFEACQKEDVDQIKYLIEQNVRHYIFVFCFCNLIIQCNINQLDDQNRTALHYCCDHKNIDCVNLLLKDDLIKKSILNLQDNEGYSALHLGILIQNNFIFFCFIKLFLACLNGNIIMVKYFCEQGADIKLVDNESHSLIHWITGRYFVCFFKYLFKKDY